MFTISFLNFFYVDWRRKIRRYDSKMGEEFIGFYVKHRGG